MSTAVTKTSPAAPPYAAQQQTAPPPNPTEIAFHAGLGYIVSACLNVALKLRIPDRIGDGVVDVNILARQAGANEDYLFRLLRVLESQQIVTRPVRRGFQLTAAGQQLRRDVAGSLAPALEWIADPLHLTLYSNLRHSVETGDTTFDAVYGEPFFSWSTRQENGEEAAVFNNAMTSISEMFIPAFLDAYPIGSFSKIVDVGGGHGAVLRAILKQNPNLSGTLAEMPSLLADAQAAIANDALADRCQAVPCNFFESVPAGGDLYFMKHIVHDWSDEQALRLLKNIRSVIPANGTLLLAEAVLDDSPAPHPGKLIDIEMIAFVGGKERTASEFRELLTASGFALQRIVPTKSLFSLVEAVPC